MGANAYLAVDHNKTYVVMIPKSCIKLVFPVFQGLRATPGKCLFVVGVQNRRLDDRYQTR